MCLFFLHIKSCDMTRWSEHQVKSLYFVICNFAHVYSEDDNVPCEQNNVMM